MCDIHTLKETGKRCWPQGSGKRSLAQNRKPGDTGKCTHSVLWLVVYSSWSWVLVKDSGPALCMYTGGTSKKKGSRCWEPGSQGGGKVTDSQLNTHTYTRPLAIRRDDTAVARQFTPGCPPKRKADMSQTCATVSHEPNSRNPPTCHQRTQYKWYLPRSSGDTARQRSLSNPSWT